MNESESFESREPTIACQGRDNMIRIRRLCIKQGMETEFLLGMKLTGKAPSAFVLAKRELDIPMRGLTGRKGKLAVYNDFCDRFEFERKPKMV